MCFYLSHHFPKEHSTGTVPYAATWRLCTVLGSTSAQHPSLYASASSPVKWVVVKIKQGNGRKVLGERVAQRAHGELLSCGVVGFIETGRALVRGAGQTFTDGWG